MNGRRRALPTAGGLPLPSKFSSCPEPSERQPAKTRYSAKEWPQLPAGCRGRGVSRGVLLKARNPCGICVVGKLKQFGLNLPEGAHKNCETQTNTSCARGRRTLDAPSAGQSR